MFPNGVLIMETFNLNVPTSSLVVESRGVQVEVKVAEIPHDVLRQVLWHGLKQKVADAASNATGLVWAEVKGKDAPKPSRDQLKDFAESHEKAIQAQTLALMQKAVDAIMAGQWQIRVAGGGTSTKWTDEQALALDIARQALQTIFAAALAKRQPGAKPTATNFVALDPKVAAYFKANEKRPTWDDVAVMAWIAKQKEAGTRDIVQEAQEELARREQAMPDVTDDLDAMLDDI